MNHDEKTVSVTPGPVERKLAAIFSADVKGYSRLMGDDEEATIRTLTAYREILATLIQRGRGRVVDSPGDNMLAEFASAVDAVRCGVEIQRQLEEKNAELPDHRQMQFRIGINVGDVIVEGERIYGDGVNIAARLEGLAEGGGVCISGTAYDQVENKLTLGYEYLGEQTVKNIAKPVRVYRIQMKPGRVDAPDSSQALAPRESLQKESVGTGKPSIAVLPFLNLSKDTEQEYFSDGITEDVITDLSKISGLLVISRNSVFFYKGATIKPEQVGRELDVRYVLEGSVRKAGSRVRISAQLVDAPTGYQLWADRYDRELDDIFALQDEVTQKIVAVLAVKLTQGEQERLRHTPTENLEAYDSFLRGRESYARRTKDANLQARQLFEQAIALDPQYSDAYAFLGRTYLMEIVYQWSQDPQAIEQVFALGQKAVAINEAQPTAHETLAYAYLGKKQHEQAIAEAEKAVAFDPNAADAYATLGEILSFMGRPEETIPLVEHAMRLNPHYSPSYLWTLGHAYTLLGRYDEAIPVLKRVVTRNPDHLTGHLMLAAIYADLGRDEEARGEAAEILRVNPDYSLAITRQRMPYRDPATVDRQLESLRKTGLT